MQRLRIMIPAIFLLIGFSFNTSYAQRIYSEITVKTDKLPQQNKNKLMGLDRIIQAYINQREWAPDDYDYEVTLDIRIDFDKIDAVDFEDRYNAQIVVNNRSNMQFMDKRWKFPYDPGSQLIFSDQFDPFRSMLDYYVFMALGHEFDKVKKFGGTQYFEQARLISQQARFSSLYYIGWEEREEWVELILEPENDQLRYLNFLYYTGEWLYEAEQDYETAKKYLLYGTKQLDKIPEEKLRRFFELNYYNYSNFLAEYREFSALTKLASLDPIEDHADLYERLLKQR